MVLPRRRDTGLRENPSGTYPTVTITGRPPTSAESQARYRAGHRSAMGRGHPDPVFRETRNGLPFTPYRYAGERGNCLTCELWLGCGGAFCDDPLERGAR